MPQLEIPLPSAPARAGPCSAVFEAECGKTETAAPVSTKKVSPDSESLRNVKPPRALSCSRRFPSFPKRSNRERKSWRCCRKTCVCHTKSFLPQVPTDSWVGLLRKTRKNLCFGRLGRCVRPVRRVRSVVQVWPLCGQVTCQSGLVSGQNG